MFANGNLAVGTTTDSGYKLDVNGTGRFSGALNVIGNLNLQSTAGFRNINFYDNTNTNINAQIQYDQLTSNTGQLFFGTNNGGTFATRLTIASTGIATFSSSVFAASYYGQTLTTSSQAAINLNNTLDNQICLAGNARMTVVDYTTTKYLFTITPTGNVGIGTSSPNSILAIRQSNTSTATVLELTNTSTGDNTTKAAQLMFMLTDTVGTVKDSAYVQAVPSSGFPNVQNADLTFATRSGDGYPTERMRITSGGYLKASNSGSYFGSTGGYHELRQTAGDSWTVIVTNNTSTPNGILVRYDGSAPNTSSSYDFLNCQDTSTTRLRIYSNGNVANANNSYGALSDIKLKENIIDTTSKLDKLMQVRIVNYNLKGEELKQIGVIAQELEQIFPSLVDEHTDKDIDNNDIGTTTKSVKYSVFVPILVKAIQEQQAQIEELRKIVATINK
jgi:hypothetical protein